MWNGIIDEHFQGEDCFLNRLNGHHFVIVPDYEARQCRIITSSRACLLCTQELIGGRVIPQIFGNTHELISVFPPQTVRKTLEDSGHFVFQ